MASGASVVVAAHADDASPANHSRRNSTESLSSVDVDGDNSPDSESECETPLVSRPRSELPAINRSATVAPVPRAVTSTSHTQRRSIGTHHEVNRSKSLLERLSDIKKARSLRPNSARKDRYSRFHELDDLNDDAPPVPYVDLSSLEGLPSFQNNVSDDEADIAKAKREDSSDQSRPLAKGTDKNARVSVKSVPTVDLSSLEGWGHSPNDSSPNGSSPRLKESSTTLTNVNFHLTNSERPNWRPWVMRSSYIAMLAVVSLVLAAVQEYLCQKSQRTEAQGRGLVQYNSVTDMPVSEFFCWKYLPTIVMVAYGILWQIADYEVKRLEPYYQLSQPTGNTAAKSLNLDYVTIWSYFVPYKSFKYRHWVPFVASIGTILATTAAPSMQNPSIMTVPNPNCKKYPGESCGDEFKFSLRIQPVWSRLVTTCLVLVAILAIIIIFQLRRKTGLLSDPRGVAGIASMATRSHILRDFDGMDEALHDDIHKKLRRRRYILYKSTIWQGEFTKQKDYDPPESTETPNPQPIILRPLSLIAFMTFMIICLPFIPAISYTRLNTVTHKLPWLPILLATLIKQLWATLEFNVKMMEPFHTLSKGNARPDQTLTLDYQGTAYGLLPARALLNKHYLVALIGIGSILCDVLTITFSSLSLSSETPSSFYSSSILSTIIVFILIVSAGLVYLRRRRPFMPRQPSTIASILAFIHQSRMLDDFVGTELYTQNQMQEMLSKTGKTYGLGWFRGRDNRPHCAIDQEPMLSRYVHGVSYIRAQAPWEENVGF